MKTGIEQLDRSSPRSRKAQGVLAAMAAAILGVALHANAHDGRQDDHHPAPKLLSCDDTMKERFRPDSLTTVLLVKAFKKGDPLALSGTPATPPPRIAANDVCVVKLLVGPGNPGPAGAPSTSPGIGIEVWLPTPATARQMELMGNASINACDVVNGQHLGYIPDPSECRYDPTHDASVLCAANGGSNTSADCVTPLQAEAMNKIWYGQTRHGTAPSPAIDNSWPPTLNSNHLWYGLARGTSPAGLAGATPFTIASDMVALELQNPTLATTSFLNATGNGTNGWRNLSYAELGQAYDDGLRLQRSFAYINTDDPDLKPFRNSGGRMLMYHGLADVLIMPQGSINYYNRVAREMGGIDKVQRFYRFFLVPGMTHGLGNGTTNASANPPLPAGVGPSGTQQLYDVLTDWVEKGIAPSRIVISSAVTTTSPVAKSRPICLYPKKAVYRGGDVNVATSYRCAD